MSIYAEHLTEDGLANIDEVLWESTALPDPVLSARELRERSIQACRTYWNRRSVTAWRTSVARRICGARYRRRRRCSIEGERNTSWIGGKDVVVVDLPLDPSLHQ